MLADLVIWTTDKLIQWGSSLTLYSMKNVAWWQQTLHLVDLQYYEMKVEENLNNFGSASD